MSGVRRPLRSRLGLPRPAHRNKSRQGTRRQEARDASDGGARRVPQVPRRNSSPAAPAVQRIGVLRSVLQTVRTMTPQYESVVLSTFFSFMRWIRLQGSARRLLVHA